MKALIWIGCCGTASIINMCLYDVGIVIGGLIGALLYGGAVWLAITLCNKWDWYTVLKKASEAGMTVTEYGRQGLSEEFLTKLEKMCNTIPYEQVKAQLKACIKKGKITKEQYIILLREYTTTK
jgi:hypothetical protein